MMFKQEKTDTIISKFVTMGNYYSNIRKKLGLDAQQWEGEGPAHLTHYWQTGSKHYEALAEEYLAEILKDEEGNYKLPFEYDVPFPPPSNPDFKFIDLFAGIGGFRIAFQGLNGQCVFSSEWDKYAKRTYEANFGEIPFGDITKFSEHDIPDHDILVGGFPCQPFSIAGVSKKNSLGRKHGFDDETQGTLFFDIKRILKEKRPKAFLLENVKNLKSHDQGRTFEIIESSLKKLGYKVYSKVLDAKHYVPQHRERIFIVGFDEKVFGSDIKFDFPQYPDKKTKVGDILNARVNKKYTLSDKLWNYLQDYANKHKSKGNGFGFGLVDLDGISRTLSARYYKDGSEILIPQKDKNPRRLTPDECKRLMGYPDSYRIEDIGVSDTQLYKQFGNSVAVPVVQAVAEKIIECMHQFGIVKNDGIYENSSFPNDVLREVRA